MRYSAEPEKFQQIKDIVATRDGGITEDVVKALYCTRDKVDNGTSQMEPQTLPTASTAATRFSRVFYRGIVTTSTCTTMEAEGGDDAWWMGDVCQSSRPATSTTGTTGYHLLQLQDRL